MKAPRVSAALLFAGMALLLPSCGSSEKPIPMSQGLEEAAKATSKGKELVKPDKTPTKKVPPAERLTGAELE